MPRRLAKMDKPFKGKPVPTGRLNRMMRMGGLAGGIGGRVLAAGAGQILRGERPRLDQLILTPANARHLANELARLRGAAMKFGQLLSLDAGELLPRELSDILSRLRAEAEPMPPAQLKKVLERAWGPDWQRRFARFDIRPIASASIGQVHRAQTRDGRDLAIKVQYPGIRTSIDSDVDNLGGLIRMSGLWPATIDLPALLAEARRQLAEEADYLREAAQMRAYTADLGDSAEFVIPRPYDDLSSVEVLAMDFIDSRPIEDLAHQPQPIRDAALQALFDLVMDELFQFGRMQTDPNFANFRYIPATGQIVLLDFGATREFAPETAPLFGRLLRAGIAGDHAALWQVSVEIGYVDAGLDPRLKAQVLAASDIAFAPFRKPGKHDFADRSLPDQMRGFAQEVVGERALWLMPPPDVMFLHRKLAGLYLLAVRMGARVDLGAALEPHLAPHPAPHPAP